MKLLYFAGHKLAAAIQKDAKQIVNHIDAAVSERRQILFPLNALNFSECSDENLLEMRRALFDAKYVVDIGFLKNNQLVCTTGSGVLKTPINDRTPDYIRHNLESKNDNNIRVRFEPKLKILLFEERIMQVVIVRQGNYNLIMDTAAISRSNIAAPYWEITYKTGSDSFHLAGKSGLSKELASHKQIPFETALMCSDKNTGYCVAVRTPWSESRRSTNNRVRKGLTKGSFYWTYQPIICLHTGKVIGCEVLARFEDKYGPLYPDEFIPVIRKNNLTWSFTQAMVAKVLKELTELDDLPTGFKVSINIIPCDVELGNVSLLTQEPALINSRFIICLEITEDEYLDTSIAHAHFRTLVDSGFNLSLDDFGTGYSNLRNLQNLSFHQLKIDRTFVQDIATQGLKASMIPNIMELVRKFNYTCVAEGIETTEQEAMLKSAGVHYGQGWKYGRPMKVDKFKRYIAQQTL